MAEKRLIISRGGELAQSSGLRTANLGWLSTWV
jgi:hypothetical protein